MRKLLTFALTALMGLSVAHAADTPAYNSGTVIGSTLTPDNDSYATHAADYQLGGWHSVSNAVAMTNLPASVTQDGMAVYVRDTSNMYVRVNGAWEEFYGGGGISEPPATNTTTVAFTQPITFNGYNTFASSNRFEDVTLNTGKRIYFSSMLGSGSIGPGALSGTEFHSANGQTILSYSDGNFGLGDGTQSAFAGSTSTRLIRDTAGTIVLGVQAGFSKLYDDGLGGIWQSEGTATNGEQIVNYQTMVAQGYGTGDMKADGSVPMTGSLDMSDEDILALNHIWAGGFTAIQIPERSLTGTDGQGTLSWGTRNLFGPWKVDNTATNGTEIVNYQTMTNVLTTGSIWVDAPASNSAPGTAGARAYDQNYLYICVSNATWRRTTLASW